MIFILDNNRGSVMSIALLMLVLLTSIVIFMSRTSTTDVEIAANARYSATAFYIADAGAYGHAKIVGKALELGRTPVPGTADLPYLDAAAGYVVTAPEDFYDQVMGFSTADLDDDMKFDDPDTPLIDNRGNEDIEFWLGLDPTDPTKSYEVNIGLSNEGVTPLFGGGAEFGSGAMGVGSGSSGGVAMNFAATSLAEGPKNSRSIVVVQYRKIPGTAGGL